MNCTEIREKLANLLYEDLPPAEAAQLKYHLAMCPGCRAEYAALENVRRLLNQVPAPEVAIDLPRLYAHAAGDQKRRLGRWRRAAVGLAAVAAALLLAIGLRLEVRLQANQVVVRWGNAPQAPDNPISDSGQNRVAASSQAKEPPVSQQEMQTLRELIYSLAGNYETLEARLNARDQQRQEELVVLRQRFNDLRLQVRKLWTETNGYVSALYTAQFGSTEKGAKQ